MNRLSTLPRGFGSLPALEVLDLTYNNLNQSSLPGNFFYLSEWKHTRIETSARASTAGRWSDLINDVFVFAATLRALYLSDNDFETIPADIEKLSKLQIVSLCW